MGEINELKPMADILIESMRSIGYTFESAMADIVDNSLSADAKSIKIQFNPKNLTISIIDNGKGMSYEELVEAMRWGSKDPLAQRDTNDLGRFGLGLKSASFSQCRKFTVISKKDGITSALIWDLDNVRNTRSWSVETLSYDEITQVDDYKYLDVYKNGTLVLWENFDKIDAKSKDLVSSLEEQLDFTMDYLALVFHRFIERKIEISVNEKILDKVDPFLKKNSYTQQLKKEQVAIKDKDGNSRTIDVIPYVLPHFNSLKQEDKELLSKQKGFRNKQGFYIYRNERLIIWGSWFRLTNQSEIYKNARVQVDIPNTLDDIWSIDVKKSSASIPSVIKNRLFHAVNDSISKSRQIYTKRAVNVNKKNGYKCVWNTYQIENKKIYSINRDLPIIHDITENMNQTQLSLLEILLKDIENNIPKYEVFTQIANQNDDDTEDEKSIEERVKSFIEIRRVSNKEMLVNVLNVLFESEPYCNYPKLKNKIIEEFKNGKTY